ncbi:MAG: hypothetical protein QF669_03880 [Candidatus Marinimicrobia bacterium]|nr:hypothetical protein [Candidatus Neomarinimicrobiota bacterium]
MNRIATKLKPFQRRLIRNDLVASAWILIPVAVVAVVSLLALEALFWLPAPIRYGFWISGLIIFIGVAAAALILTTLIKMNGVSRYSIEKCALQVGTQAFEKQDKVLNAYQLEDSLTQAEPFSSDLASDFISRILTRLETLDPLSVLSNTFARKLWQPATAVVVLSLVAALAFLPEFIGSARRWIHPRTTFSVPLPFQIKSEVGDLALMGGDNAVIAFRTTGDHKVTDHLMVEVVAPEKREVTELFPSEDGSYRHELQDIFQNLRYRAYVKATHFWQPWDEITSPHYRITVIDRPTIEQFAVTINPPAYTGLEASVQGGNIAEIRGFKGSGVEIELKSDKPLSRAYLEFSKAEEAGFGQKSDLTVTRNRATGRLSLMEDRTFSTYIFDGRGIGNLDPIEYHLIALEDVPPTLEVLLPEDYTELGSDFTVPVHLHIEDDFGFSNLQIVYETRHPDYLSTGSATQSRDLVSIHSIHSFSKEETSQDVYTIWDVSSLNLMPEDELEFHIELYDNDEVSGPKKAVSPTLTARFPSLTDLYARTLEQEESVEEDARQIQQELKRIDEVLESIELEALKQEKLNWEQQQSVKKSIETVQEKLEQIQSLQEALQKIAEQSDKHELFSPDLIEKFRNLNELLQDVLTPELLQAMEQLQEATTEVTPEQLLQALEDFRLNTTAVERQLDRFIDIFKRIQAEQKIDELVSRMELLTERQENLAQRTLEDTNRGESQNLAEEQLRNSQEFENIKELMSDAARDMEPFARMPSDELEELAQSYVADETSRELKAASRQLRRDEMKKGSQSAIQGAENLNRMTTDITNIRESFRGETVEAMVAKFEKALQNTLYISKEQEELQQETKNLPRNSPRLGKMANRQQLLRDQLSQLIGALMQLSSETFAVSPEMGKAIGRATAGMNESLTKLEERNGRAAVESQGTTVSALNEAALATLAAINAIEQSGSAAGLEQFMERMRQMAGQQKGINDLSLQLALGQMAAFAQEQMRQRLQRQQEQLKKSLEQLMREMRGSSRGTESLSGIAEEMDEVIKDFQLNKVDRRTVERQQKILSRMLDSQRSMKQRDFSEKRKGTTAVDIDREGPSGLPSDLGQRRNLAMEALSLALKAGYSRDYQEMIRTYFNTLVEVPEVRESDQNE